MRDSIYRVVDKNIFVKSISEYTNGISTTAGFFERDELEKCSFEPYGITYDSFNACELPFEWPNMYFLDDKDKRQKIKKIDFFNIPAYLMEDDTMSETVTG